MDFRLYRATDGVDLRARARDCERCAERRLSATSTNRSAVVDPGADDDAASGIGDESVFLNRHIQTDQIASRKRRCPGMPWTISSLTLINTVPGNP